MKYDTVADKLLLIGEVSIKLVVLRKSLNIPLSVSKLLKRNM